MKGIVGILLMLLCGFGVVMLLIGFVVGWSPGEKGHESAVSGAGMLVAWAILQAWYARRR